MSATTKQLSDYQVLFCGKATFTLESAQSGKHYTYRISKVEDALRPAVYFVSLLTGPDNTNDYQYLGMASPDAGSFRTTRASRLPVDSAPVRGIVWLIRTLHSGLTAKQLPGGMRLLWADQCQRCGRALTVPSSIDARLGPECAKKM